jgi:hypothetical protein
MSATCGNLTPGIPYDDNSKPVSGWEPIDMWDGASKDHVPYGKVLCRLMDKEGNYCDAVYLHQASDSFLLCDDLPMPIEVQRSLGEYEIRFWKSL